MVIFIAIILGILEGLTEFLPVSSTGHLIIAGYALNFTGAKAATFEVFIQLGAILAVVWLYRDRFRQLLMLSRGSRAGESKGLQGRNGLLLLGLTTAPALVAGLLLHGTIKDYLFQPLTVAIGLAAGGVIILLFENRQSQNSLRGVNQAKTTMLDTITKRQAIGIGCAQLVALWPGVSRSGATIIGGVLYGLDRKTAVEYSFLAAVPVMIAATSYDLLKNLDVLQVSDIPLFATGFITAFISAAIAIKYFVRFVQRYSFKPFAYYRIALSGLVVILLV